MKKFNVRDGKNMLLGGILALTMVNGSALATTVSEFIEVSYIGITVYINGIKTPVKDTTGAETEPFVHNGTTYVPLAFISQSLGEPVQWDGTTNSIYIGQSATSNNYLLDVCPPYQVNGNTSSTDGTAVFKMAGKTYTNGYSSKLYNNVESEVLFNLDGKYDSFDYIFGHVDDADTGSGTAYIYLDGKLAKEFDFAADKLPEQQHIDLNGALQMKIVLKAGGYYNTSTYGFAEMIVK